MKAITCALFLMLVISNTAQSEDASLFTEVNSYMNASKNLVNAYDCHNATNQLRSARVEYEKVKKSDKLKEKDKTTLEETGKALDNLSEKIRHMCDPSTYESKAGRYMRTSQDSYLEKNYQKTLEYAEKAYDEYENAGDQEGMKMAKDMIAEIAKETDVEETEARQSQNEQTPVTAAVLLMTILAAYATILLIWKK